MESFEPMVRKLCSGQEMLHKINQRGIIKTEQGRVTVLVHCTLSHCQTPAYQVWTLFGPMMTKLRSGQGKREDADADTDADDAVDHGNTYMSPFQATQKV